MPPESLLAILQEGSGNPALICPDAARAGVDVPQTRAVHDVLTASEDLIR